MMNDLFSDSNDREVPFILPRGVEYSSQWNDKLSGFDIKIPHGELFYSEHYFDDIASNKWLQYFLENDSNDWRKADWRSINEVQFENIKFKNIEWQHDKLMMYGKEVYLPRYSAWYGDQDKPYTYSGLTLQPKGWNEKLQYIKSKLNEICSSKFNSVLMNWYRGGEDYINWHTDAEKELGENPTIGSVNFGETRDFILRRNDKSEKISIPLKHGSVLVMKGELQHHWEHSVPKRTRARGNRVNLTFRIIDP